MMPSLAIRRFILLAALSVAIDCAANDQFSHPGGVAQLTLYKDSTDFPEVQFGLNQPVIMEYPDHWRILIGLSLETLPGDYVAYVKSGLKGSSGRYEKIVVKQHSYQFREYSSLKGNVSAQAVNKTNDIFSDLDFSNTQQPSLPLRWPLDGNWSNNFGDQLYDTKRGDLHTPNAIAINVNKLSSVIAPQTAIISKIETSEAGVSTVYLDHGRGLYSILSGLSDITIKVGNGVVAGAVIGKLPATGKGAETNSTPADHTLVWQTVINNAYVDPQVLTLLEP